jgi:hypothetical protein
MFPRDIDQLLEFEMAGDYACRVSWYYALLSFVRSVRKCADIRYWL